MKKATIIIAVLILTVSAGPAYCFVDYLFGGSSRGAIDNSALGDLRAWWSGNPAYQFNPFYSGPGMPQQARQAPPSTMGNQQQMWNYSQGTPGNQQYFQQGGANPYGPGPAMGQVQAPPAYQNPAYRGYAPNVQQPAPQYQTAPQGQYQAAPQPRYQTAPQMQYQSAPQPQYQQMQPQYQGQSPVYQGR